MWVCCTLWFILTAAKLQQYAAARLAIISKDELKIKCKNTVDNNQIYKRIHLFIFWEDITNANIDTHNKRAPPKKKKKGKEEAKLEQM